MHSNNIFVGPQTEDIHAKSVCTGYPHIPSSIRATGSTNRTVAMQTLALLHGVGFFWVCLEVCLPPSEQT